MFGEVELGLVGRSIASADVVSATDDELCDATVALARLSSQVAAGLAHVLGELDARRVCDREHGLATHSWLAREAGVPQGVARSHLKTARVLRDALSDVDAAVTEGRLTFHHAKALADAVNPRVTDAVADLHPELIALADEAGFERWKGEVRGVVEMLDQDGGHDPHNDLARNTLAMAETIDGVTHLSGQLAGDTALGVSAAIEAKADELFRRFSADREVSGGGEVPGRATLRALALAELCRAGNAVDVAATRPPRPEVTLVVRADEPGETMRADGARLADGTTRTLRCDPDLFAVVVNSLGVPLDMGRQVRLATAAQRRAMAARDGSCVFPGCTAPPAWCDAPSSRRVPLGRPHGCRPFGVAVPPPPWRDSPHRLGDARDERRLVLVDHTVREHHLEPTPRPPTNRTDTDRRGGSRCASPGGIAPSPRHTSELVRPTRPTTARRRARRRPVRGVLVQVT
jgi:hypothetical protein